MKRRILSIMLTCCMTLSLLPISVFAEIGSAKPKTCTCEIACTEKGLDEECPICGADDALPEDCAKAIKNQKNGDRHEIQASQNNISAPIAVQAGGTHSDHCVCGGSVTVGGHMHEGTPAKWQAWDGTGEITYTNGLARVYLTGDVETNLTLEEGQHLSLCLNGKKFTCKDKTQPAVTLNGTSKNSYSVLDICDCVGGGTLGGRTGGEKGGSVYAEWSDINLYGGTLTGNSGVKLGGAVTVDHGPLTMYGGAISGNSAENGGAIATANDISNMGTKDGKLVLYGGEISNNTATGNGGAIYSNFAYGYFDIYGGVISGNHADGNGGGIYIRRIGGITIKAGEIKNNTATGNGGGICLDSGSYAYLLGGIISDNSAKKGGGIYLDNQNFTLGSIRITVNTASEEGGGFWMKSKSPYNNVTDSPYVYENTTTGIAPNVYCGEKNAVLKLYSRSGNIDVNLGADAKIGIYFIGIPDSGASLQSYGNSYNISKADIEKFICENPDYARIEARTNSSNPKRGYEGWICNTAPETTVTFDPCGGTLSASDESKSVQRNGIYGTLPVPKRLNYRFEGWFTEKDGGTKVEEITTVTSSENHTLYAHWTFIHEHCICGDSVDVGDHTAHSGVAFTAWNGTDAINYTNKTAYVYLTQNATINSNLVVDGTTLYLCLGGKTFASNGTNKIQVKNGGHLVICDCAGGGTVKGATKGWGGSCIYLYKSTLDIFGGKITGGKVTGKGGGGGIALDDSKCVLNMYGGEISGNDGRWCGGAILLNDADKKGGTVNMYGGTITGNKADKGGVLFSSCGGTVLLAGGTITGNEARKGSSNGWGCGGVINMAGGMLTVSGTKIIGNTAQQYGGAVYLYDGVTAYMTGGELSNNKAASEGGAVHVYGKNSTFNLSGGTVSGNSSKDGGAIYLNREPSVLTMTGGTIIGNTATGNGGAVYIYRSGSICNLSGGTIENNTATGSGGGIYINPSNNGQLNISGAPVVKDNTVSGNANNVYLPSGKKLSVDAMTNGARVGITTQNLPVKTAPVVFGNANDRDYSGYFSSDREDYIPRYNSDRQLELSAITYPVIYQPGSDGIGDAVDDLKEKNVPLILHGALFTRNGYTQTGWSTSDGGEKVYGLDAVYTADASLTLYPFWTVKTGYTVNFVDYDGKSLGSKTVAWTDNVLADAPAPDRGEGWSFNGWNHDTESVNSSANYASLAKLDTVVSITLTAQWKDIEKPTGEIKIGKNKWNIFLNDIFFNLFFKDTQTVTITAEDNSAQTVAIEYYLSDKKLTKTELENKTLKKYTEPFEVDPDNEYIIYAKLTDSSDNTEYICSEGIVLDGTAPVISGIENGKTYCEARTVTVTEKYVDKVTVNGNEVSLDENNRFILSPANGKQQIVVTDKAGNTAEMTVTVNDGHKAGQDDGDCTTAVTCECGYVIKAAKPAHDFSGEWHNDENGHWHVCSNDGCAVTDTKESHSGTDDGDCTTAVTCECGYIIKSAKPEHDFSGEWHNDENGHWHVCSNDGCAVTDTKESHSGTDDGDCTTAVTCECGYIIKSAKSEHDFSGEWHNDENGHWHVCSNDDCTVTDTKETHSGTDDGDCTTAVTCECGYIIKSAKSEHDFSGEWHNDENGHWHVCSNDGCAVTDTKESHSGTATCTEKAVCEHCGEIFGNLDSDNHTGEEKWIKTATKHEKKYDCCGKVTVAEENHNWENGICKDCGYTCKHRGGKATCTEKAVCKYCGEKYGKPNPDNHTGEAKWIRTATDHKKEYDCCGKVAIADENHNWEDGVCKDCGYGCEHTGGKANCNKGAVCERCRNEYGRLDPDNHSGKEKWIKTATKHERKYDCCGKVTVAEENHSWENGICKVCGYACKHTGGKATCTEKAVCEHCGEKYGKFNPDNHIGEAKWIRTATDHKKEYDCCGKAVISAESHNWEDGSCKDCGYTCKHTGGKATCTEKAVCKYCGEKYGKLDPENHSGEEKWIKTVTKHEKKYDCCGKVAISAKSHNWENGICKDCGYTCKHTGGKATCTEEAVCEHCGERYGKPDAKNHSALGHIKAKAATKSANGNIEYWYCKDCNRYYRDAAATKEIAKSDTVIPKLSDDVNSPHTDKESNFTLWLILLMLSGGSIIGTTVIAKRKKRI